MIWRHSFQKMICFSGKVQREVFVLWNANDIDKIAKGADETMKL